MKGIPFLRLFCESPPQQIMATLPPKAGMRTWPVFIIAIR